MDTEKRGETKPQNPKLSKLPQDKRPLAPKDKRDGTDGATTKRG